MKWFKHDTDASIDAKLQTLLLDYGATGYGLYWYCVELIAQGVSDKNITFELEHDARIIARNLNLSVQETKDMMKYMIDLKLFSISSNDKLACYALAKRIDQSMTSNQNMRSLIKDIKQNHDKIMTVSKDSHDKVIAEEKRIDKNRKDIFTFTLTRKTAIENTSAEYKEKLKAYIQSQNKKMTYEDFYNACESKDYKYKNFKLAYDQWTKNELPQEKVRKPIMCIGGVGL